MKSIYKNIFEKTNNNETVILKYEFKNKSGNTNLDMEKKILQVKDLAEDEINKISKRGLYLEKSEDDFKVYQAFTPKERIIILGGGHVATSFAEFSSKVGFYTVIVDDRLTFANKNRFPFAEEVICNNFENAIEDLKISSSDYVVLVTRGHRYDANCLRTLAKGKIPKYTGMIGSKRRVIMLKKMMIDEGCDKNFINGLHSPIGLDIGAVTPEEIAVSIVAEVINFKRNLCKEDLSSSHSIDDSKILEIISKDENLEASLLTIIKASGSVPRKEGGKMMVFKDGSVVGTIGGGCTENEAVLLARDIIGTKSYKVFEVSLSDDLAEEEGMACGGSLKVLVEDL